MSRYCLTFSREEFHCAKRHNDNIILMIVADVQGFVFQKISPENMIEIIENCVLKGRGQWKISL